MVDEALAFEWDEAKSTRNRIERGFGFDLASESSKVWFSSLKIDAAIMENDAFWQSGKWKKNSLL